MKTFAHSCADCKGADYCKHAFSRYWAEKSSGGKGCNHPPFDERNLAAFNEVIGLMEEQEDEPQQAEWAF